MEKHPVLLIDNFDSFTYNLVDYLYQAGVSCEVYRNDIPLTQYVYKEYSGVLLSPGPKRPGQAGHLMQVLGYYENRLPILGICLGHQAIGEYFGWELSKALRPMHGKISRINNNGQGIFCQLPEAFEVVRYHSLVLKEVPLTDLRVTSKSLEGEIMGIAHQSKAIWGIQFHPEAALTAYGHEMIGNWVASLPNTL